VIKLAFGSVPKDGGTFTFYRNMRPALLEHGIDMRCVSVGKEQERLIEPAYIDEGCVLLAPKTRSIKKQALAFCQWCVDTKMDIVLGINSEAILSALPHLPEHIRCLSRCANSFDHGYRITLSCYERLGAIIAQTPRQYDDLVNRYDADKSLISVIPNGIDPKPFEHIQRKKKPDTSKALNLGFLGRLEHSQKGVFFLPEILNALDRKGVSYTLKIVGKGKDEPRLRKQLNAQISNGKVQLLGALPPDKIPDFLANTEVFLFPSQFEGCPNALIEAMMAGCVPVAWNLKGITDFIIDEGISGQLAPIGQSEIFAGMIADISNSPTRLWSMQREAITQSRERFSTSRAAEAYANVFKSAMDHDPPNWNPRQWGAFMPDPNFIHSWKDWIPEEIKDLIKKNIITD